MQVVAELATNPYMMTLLLTMGLIGIGVEMLHPGLGIPGIIGVGAFAFYFLGHYAVGLTGWEAPALFIIGMVLLLFEVFVPSFGLIGIIGFVAVIIAIIIAASNVWVGVTAFVISLTLTLLVLWLLVRIFHLKPSWSKLILQSAQKNEEGFISAEDRQYLLGQVGTTLSPLRPAGVVQFGEQRHDVVSEGHIIPSGVQVKVMKVEGVRVIVRKTEENSSSNCVTME
jgi:membrane-bound ClpP family serine protease